MAENQETERHAVAPVTSVSEVPVSDSESQVTLAQQNTPHGVNKQDQNDVGNARKRRKRARRRKAKKQKNQDSVTTTATVIKGDNARVKLRDCVVYTSAAVNPNTSNTPRRKTDLQLEAKKRKSENCTRLPNSILFFNDQILAQSPNSNAIVFAGVAKNDLGEEYPDHHLAVKLILAPTEKNFREAKNLQTLEGNSHVNVVSIKHTGVYTKNAIKYLYIAMHRCSVVNLESYLKDRKAKNIPVNLRQAIDFSKQIVEGLNHIHLYNILHRDLKPSSALFSNCGKFVKICDFGISKQLRDGFSVTKLSTLPTTTDGYRAPETYNKDEISKKADIFSLGLVLHFLLSYGFHAFGIERTLWANNIKFCKNLDLSRLRDPFKDKAEELLQKMLQENPENRPTIEEVRDHAIFKFDWRQTLLQDLKKIGSGRIKDRHDTMELSCTLYRSSELSLDSFGSGWTFEMKTVQNFGIGSLKEVADEEPSGYFVASSNDQVQKLAEHLVNHKQIAWIDASGEGVKMVFVLVCHKDYPELFGFFLPNKKVISRLLGAVQSGVSKGLSGPQSVSSSAVPAEYPTTSTAASTPTVKKPKARRQTKKPVKANSDLSRPQSVSSSAGTTKHSTMSPAASTPAVGKEKAPKQTEKPIKANSDLIAWWTLTEEFLKTKLPN